mmetsp:Transcript_12842/g.35188  ORF Transcript_12842/g.35188 Transcript_12842/m.35188 type:complete len:278 (-) Transcript_12842:910-1743(-)
MTDFFTPQQRAGGIRYKPHTLIGNWQEDLALQEKRLADYVDKKEAGTLQITNTTKAVELLPAELSPPESVLRVGASAMLQSNAHEKLSVSVKKALPGEMPRRVVSCSPGGPSSRTAISLLSYRDAVPTGEPITYGSKIVIAFKDWNLALGSACPSTATLGSQVAGKQEIFAAELLRSGDFAWEIMPADFSQRLPMSGSPVDPSAPFVLVHCMTGSRLAATTDRVVTDFGVESAVCAHTFQESAGRMHRCMKEANGFPYMPHGSRRETEPNLWRIVFS